MRKPRVYVDAGLASGRSIELEDDRGHYLKNVLRLQPGAAFFLFDGKRAIDFEATLRIDGKTCFADIGESYELDTESALDTEILSALGRSDHSDWMIQKTTELGVRRIALFNAERTQSPLKAAQLEKKLKHWRGIAISACEQCGRAVLPEIAFQQRLEQALDASVAELKLLLEFDGEPLLASLAAAPASVAILLGPEGGLNAAEIDLARARGFVPVSLGKRVLRFETAAVATLAVVQAQRP